MRALLSGVQQQQNQGRGCHPSNVPNVVQRVAVFLVATVLLNSVLTCAVSPSILHAVLSASAAYASSSSNQHKTHVKHINTLRTVAATNFTVHLQTCVHH